MGYRTLYALGTIIIHELGIEIKPTLVLADFPLHFSINCKGLYDHKPRYSIFVRTFPMSVLVPLLKLLLVSTPFEVPKLLGFLRVK